MTSQIHYDIILGKFNVSLYFRGITFSLCFLLLFLEFNCTKFILQIKSVMKLIIESICLLILYLKIIKINKIYLSVHNEQKNVTKVASPYFLKECSLATGYLASAWDLFLGLPFSLF